MPDAPLFSVFTATYNRCGTLERVFRSLERQTFTDFEWLIVDDGSTDDTQNVVAEFAKQASFKVVYFRQSNRGKYRAWNAGVKAASGRFIANVDSDDAMLPQGLECLIRAWESIPREKKDHFVGVTGLCVDDAGMVVGDHFPQDVFDSDSASANFRFHILGDKAGFVRRDVAAAHLFPEHLDTRFIPEGRIWLDIARNYQTRFINQPILIIHDNGGGRLSALARPVRAHGDLEYNRFALDHYGPKFPIQGLKSAVLAARAAIELGKTWPEILAMPGSTAGTLVVAAVYPFAALLHARDLVRGYGKLGLLAAISRALPPSIGGKGMVKRAWSSVGAGEQLEINVLDFRMSLDVGNPFERALVLFPRASVTRGIAFLRDALPESATFIDLHAGEGFRTLYLSRRLASGRVCSVEQVEARRVRCLKSVEMSCAYNVTVMATYAELDDKLPEIGGTDAPIAVSIKLGADSAEIFEDLFSSLPDPSRVKWVLLNGPQDSSEAIRVSRWLSDKGFATKVESKCESILARDAAGTGRIDG